jgi:hypothetical protein
MVKGKMALRQNYIKINEFLIYSIFTTTNNVVGLAKLSAANLYYIAEGNASGSRYYIVILSAIIIS